MRKIRNLLPLALFALAASSRATSLAVWNFNDGTVNGTTQANEDALFGVDRTDASIASTSMSTTFPLSGVTGAAGTTTGADGTDVAGNALRLYNNVNNGQSLTFSVKSKNGDALSNLNVGFAIQKGSSLGFSNNQLAYSTDGSTFTDFGAAFGPASNASYDRKSFDLSSVAALNGVTTATFRITFKGALSSAGGDFIDNLVVGGSARPVPEPASMAALGMGALGLIRRRRQ